VCFLFSAHGLPQSFIDMGDTYKQECEESFRLILEKFPSAIGKLSFQSKFGRGKWIEPATDAVLQNIQLWNEGRKHIVLVPLSFTSDHIETLFEVENLYLPIIREQNLFAYRCPAFNRDPAWVETLLALFQDKTIVKKQNDALIFAP
jgi:ferrochelatase